MISTIINYCSNDFRFIKKNIIEALKFSDKVVIPISSHLFDGTPEDSTVLQKTYELLGLSNKIEFIEYEWNPQQSPRYHHNMSRWIGIQQCNTEYILLLDADEIMEGDLTREYLETQVYTSYDVIAFKCYWYFRDPIYRARSTELAASLWNKNICTQQLIFTESERWSYRQYNNLNVLEEETYKGNILCHHYSWVRTHDQMLNKVRSWGHNKDRNWEALVNEEFSRNFNGTDFVHNYSYDIVTNSLDEI